MCCVFEKMVFATLVYSKAQILEQPAASLSWHPSIVSPTIDLFRSTPGSSRFRKPQACKSHHLVQKLTAFPRSKGTSNANLPHYGLLLPSSNLLAMQPWALVSPASRGIGLHLARHLLQNTKLPIVTTARKDLDHAKETILDGLHHVDESRLNVLKLDVLGMHFAFWAARLCSWALMPT
jgi:hypothetical protein